MPGFFPPAAALSMARPAAVTPAGAAKPLWHDFGVSRPPFRLAWLAAVTLAASALSASAQPARRPLQIADIDGFRTIGDLTIAPDGAWVAYAVATSDVTRDKDDADVWLSNWAGTEHLRLTSGPEAESEPRFSPDGKWIAFLSGRSIGDDDKVKNGQVWLLDRRGGEARRLTERKGGVSDVQWSPDSARLVLVGDDPDPEADKGDDDKTPKKPIVIDRFRFKTDSDGYLSRRRSHLYLLTIATGAMETLTTGDWDDELPAWSPDGTRIAFVSGRGGDADRTNDTNVFVVEAKAGAEPKALTTWNGPDRDARPAWSPDGASIAYLQGSEPRFYAYSRNTLAVVPAAGGTPRLLTDAATIDVESPVWAPDGKSLYVIAVDDRARVLCRVPAGGGPLERLTSGRRVVRDPVVARDGRVAVIASTGTTAPEIHGLSAPAAGAALAAITHQNDAWLSAFQLGAVQDLDFSSPDGTKVGAVLVKPAAYQAGTRYPLILYIHGGPNGQDQHELDLESQVLAGQGYAVLNVNYRGSAGRDQKFQQAIYADWGHYEVVDLLAGVDAAVAKGIADPARLGIGGWSYGGISTNYTIATDTRFKAAISGAGSSMQFTMYGMDQYIIQYDQEMGQPWKSKDKWMKVSYPFFNADKIKTPTLFMGGEKDFNVPIAGGEQMYQALKSLGVDTQLVIYPGQFHGLTIPSYERDRLQRYLNWFNKYLQPTTTTTASK
jgi:dipeptidyl aminopeptidase/acylaminoacyl peptidase